MSYVQYELCMSYVWCSLAVSALRIHYADVKVALPVQRRMRFEMQWSGWIRAEVLFG